MFKIYELWYDELIVIKLLYHSCEETKNEILSQESINISCIFLFSSSLFILIITRVFFLPEHNDMVRVNLSLVHSLCVQKPKKIKFSTYANCQQLLILVKIHVLSIALNSFCSCRKYEIEWKTSLFWKL